MQTTAEETDKHVVRLTVEVPPEEVGWLLRKMIGEVTHKFYLDSEYVGGGTNWKGYAFEFPASPGSHRLEVEGFTDHVLGKVSLDVKFEKDARYEIRLTALNHAQFKSSSLDLLRKRS